MNKQILKRSYKYTKANAIELDIESVSFTNYSLSDKDCFEFLKGQNKYIRSTIVDNKGNIPVVGASLENECIYDYVTPLSKKDVVLKSSVSFNKDNAKGSRAFFRNYPYVMDRHHIAIVPDSDKINPEYLYFFLDDFLRNQSYGWGENVATVESVQVAEIPIPNDLNEEYNSIAIQKILVDFIKYEQNRFGSKLKTLSGLYEKFELLEKLVVPRTLSKSRSAMEKFQRFLERENQSFDLDGLEFERKPVHEKADFPSISRVTGGVDIKPEDFDYLDENEKSTYVPLVSGTVTNNQISGYIKKDRLSDNNYSPSPCLSWTRINASIFFKQNQPVCINDDSFVITAKENESSLDYLNYSIPIEASKQGFGWGNKAGISKIKDLEISMPRDLPSLSSFEVQEILSTFFSKYMSEINGKKATIKQLEGLIPQYQDEFVQLLFTSLKKQANGQ